MTHASFLTAAAALAVLVTGVAGVLGGSSGGVALASGLALAHLAGTADASRAFVLAGGRGDERGVRMAALRLVGLQLVGLVAIAALAGALGAEVVALGWSIWPLGGLCAAGVEALRAADARAPNPSLEATW